MIENIDVDKTWDGKGSLDEHRQKMFATIEEVGFGIHAKEITKPVTEVISENKMKGDSDGT